MITLKEVSYPATLGRGSLKGFLGEAYSHGLLTLLFSPSDDLGWGITPYQQLVNHLKKAITSEIIRSVVYQATKRGSPLADLRRLVSSGKTQEHVQKTHSAVKGRWYRFPQLSALPLPNHGHPSMKCMSILPWVQTFSYDHHTGRPQIPYSTCWDAFVDLRGKLRLIVLGRLHRHSNPTNCTFSLFVLWYLIHVLQESWYILQVVLGR